MSFEAHQPMNMPGRPPYAGWPENHYSGEIRFAVIR
jgi:hypothetical protein